MAKAKHKLEETKRNRKRDRPVTVTVDDRGAAECATAPAGEVQELVTEVSEPVSQNPATTEPSEARNICELAFSLDATSTEGDGKVTWYQAEISDTIKKVVSAAKTLVKSMGPRLTIEFRIADNEVRLRVVENKSQQDFRFQGGAFPGNEIEAAPQAIAKKISDTFSDITNESAESLDKMIAEGKINGAFVDFARLMSNESIALAVKDGESEINIPVPAKEKIPMRVKQTVRTACTLTGTITAKGDSGEYYLDGGAVRFNSSDHYEIGITINVIGAMLSTAREMKVAESFEKIEIVPRFA